MYETKQERGIVHAMHYSSFSIFSQTYTTNTVFFRFLKIQNFYKGQDIVTLKRNHLRHLLKHNLSPKGTFPQSTSTRTRTSNKQLNWINECNSHSSAHTERSHAYKQCHHWSCWSHPWFTVPSSLCTEQNHHFKEIPHAISQHNIFTQENYCNKDITDTLFPMGWKELDEILCTRLWEKRK